MPVISLSDLEAVSVLLRNAKSSEFNGLVISNADKIRRVAKASQRIQRIAPDVEVSPYIVRAIRILENQAAPLAGGENVAVAA